MGMSMGPPFYGLALRGVSGTPGYFAYFQRCHGPGVSGAPVQRVL
jgi:hypothetical protein